MQKKGPRSSPYPSYSIQYCMDLVAKIYSNFGSGNYFAKREEIAKVIGVSAAHMQTQVSSATQYGLLDLKQGEGYKPSELFRQIHKPLDEKSKNHGLISVFKSPPLYVALIEKFENEILPSIIPLTNILIHHHNISDAAADKAASIFIENAKDFNFIDNDNHLSFKASAINSPNANEENNEYSGNEELDIEEISADNDIIIRNSDSKNAPDVKAINSYTNQIERFSNAIPFNIPLKGQRTAQIIVPSDVKITDFDFIINFINLMKQQYD